VSPIAIRYLWLLPHHAAYLTRKISKFHFIVYRLIHRPLCSIFICTWPCRATFTNCKTTCYTMSYSCFYNFQWLLFNA